MQRYQIVVDAVIGLLFALVALPVEFVVLAWDDSYPSWLAIGGSIVITVLFAGAVAIARLSPALSLGTAWLAAIVQMLMIRPPSFADIAIFGVLFATAVYGSRRVFWAGLISVGVGALVIAGYGTWFFTRGSAGGLGLQGLAVEGLVISIVAMFLAALFGLGLSWTIGALVRAVLRGRQTRLEQEVAQARAAAEHERVRIARDMHDVVAHSLTVIVAQSNGARYAAAANPAAASEALSTIAQTAGSALADVRVLLAQLRHTESDGPQPTLTDLDSLYRQIRAAGLAVDVVVDPQPPGIPPAAVQLAVFRILQEALTNALRHGAGGMIRVRQAWFPGAVQFEVRNPVLAAPAEPTRAGMLLDLSGGGAAGHGGHGLIGMRERAQLVGGVLTAQIERNEFVVRGSIPIGPQQAR